MRYDVVIIGGGLSALVCGITLQKAGKQCLIVSAGQSALHFFSGSFELLATEEPLAEAVAALPSTHPYQKIGPENVMRLAQQVPALFAEFGYSLRGDGVRNHTRLTPLGVQKPAWLTVEDFGHSSVRSKMPISPLGVDMQTDMRKYFIKLGGECLSGDRVIGADFEGDKLLRVYTRNHGDSAFSADDFVLATGSFFGGGLLASNSQITEPALGLDVDYFGARPQWTSENMFSAQPYMKFGAATKGTLFGVKGGKTIHNVYVIGSLLSGANPIKDGCGAGVAIISALYTTENIIAK